MLKRVWGDPVWSGVIAGGILAAVGAIGTYLLGYWPTIIQFLYSCWLLIVASSEVPNWVIALLALGASLSLIVVVGVTWSLIAPKNSNVDDWRTYTTDHFFNLRWRWTYTEGRITNLISFCPNCDYQIFPTNSSSFDVVDRVAFNCDCCRCAIVELDESFMNVESKIRRFIQQKIRNGAWRLASEV